jgi:hypothetical protein
MIHLKVVAICSYAPGFSRRLQRPRNSDYLITTLEMTHRTEHSSVRIGSTRLDRVEQGFLFNKYRGPVPFNACFDSTQLDRLIAPKTWVFTFKSSAFHMTFPHSICKRTCHGKTSFSYRPYQRDRIQSVNLRDRVEPSQTESNAELNFYV